MSATCAPRLVVSLRNGRQLLQERDDQPDLLVGHPDLAKTRHAGRLDAILHDPEKLARFQPTDDVLEIGRVRIEALGKLRPAHAWAAVAVGAASFGKGARTCL